MNCLFSDLRRIHILAQYHAQSLYHHQMARWNFLARELGEYIEIVPPKLRAATTHYRGTADAVYRNLGILDTARPDVVLILSGDHVYRADYKKFIETHVQRDADVTVLTSSVNVGEASSFGVVEIADDSRISGFAEKPADPSIYSRDGRCLINLGVYCFQTRFLVEQLVADAKRKTAHDFGKNILPTALRSGLVVSSPLELICPDRIPYWRDVGTLDSYFDASMDLLRTPAAFDVRDPRWPETSRFNEWVPARCASKASIGGKTVTGRNLVASGVEIEDAQVVNSILSPRVRVERDAELEECVLLPGVQIGRGAKLRRVIVEEGVRIPAGVRIGFGGDSEDFLTSPRGVVAVSGRSIVQAAGADAENSRRAGRWARQVEIQSSAESERETVNSTSVQ